MELVALAEHTGVEVRNVDLRDPIDEATAAALRAALAEHRLLVFRDQQLEAEDQCRAGAVFGSLVDEGGDGRFHVFISNAREDGVLGDGKQLLFHSDNMFTDVPVALVGLYGLVIGEGGAPTRFADTEWAAAQLTERQRAALADAEGLHLSGFAGGWFRYRDAETAPHHPRAVHPVLWPNPRTGRVALCVSEQQTDRLLGWDLDESEAMLAELCALLYSPGNVVEHHWRTGDLVVWDNLSLQHGRPAVVGGERTLRRVAMVDTDASEQRAWTKVSLAAEGKG